MDNSAMVFGLMVAALLGVLIGMDATRRWGGGAGAVWGIFTFLLAIVAIPCYLIAIVANKPNTPQMPARVCPKCGLTSTTAENKFCAGCGKNFAE